MSILTRYIFIKYLRNFFIVLISLEIFFVGIDFLQNYKSIPQSANLQLLYIAYNAFFTLTLALPLSLVFSFILTLIVFIRNNEFMVFFALGAKKRDILTPVVSVALALLTFLIILQMTPLAYSYEEKKKILNNEYFSSTKSDIFIKYNDYFIYFKKLLPIEKEAQNIHIYKIENGDVVETIIANRAKFENNRWNILDAKIITKPKQIDESSKLDINYLENISILEGFIPKILNNIYESRSDFSLQDAFKALFISTEQNYNTQKMRTSIYNQLFIPFFVIPIIFLLFAYSSLSNRFFNLGKFIVIGVFGTLVVWGFFFFLFKITSTSSTIPEFSMLLPLMVWFILSAYLYVKKINNI